MYASIYGSVCASIYACRYASIYASINASINASLFATPTALFKKWLFKKTSHSDAREVTPQSWGKIRERVYTQACCPDLYYVFSIHFLEFIHFLKSGPRKGRRRAGVK